MSFFSSVKNMLQPQQRSTVGFITVTSTDNYGELPPGFFRVECASGRKALGYKGGFVSFDCGETVVDGQRITLSVPRESLPVVKLNFSKPTDGVFKQVGGASVVDTDALEADDGAVVWDGARPADGPVSR
jgi:hypothetical protein